MEITNACCSGSSSPVCGKVSLYVANHYVPVRSLNDRQALEDPIEWTFERSSCCWRKSTIEEKFLFNYFLAQLEAKIAAIWKHVERNESLNDGSKLFINLLNTWSASRRQIFFSRLLTIRRANGTQKPVSRRTILKNCWQDAYKIGDHKAAQKFP